VRHERLAGRWRALVRASGVDPARAAPHLDALLAAYSGPRRAYHGPRHLAHVLAALDRAGAHDPAVLWAAFAHDVVHVPGRRDNEARSAAWARRTLEALGLGALAPRVAALVLATRRHEADPGDEAALLLLDADLVILGAPARAYRRYARAVRDEHRRLPAFLWARGRRAFLRSALARPAIFATDPFRVSREARARANLAAELAALDG
jgi:predicted metal-dependent HD superfamily phosphohydrolase